MSDKNKKSDKDKTKRRPLPQSDISTKRKEIFDLSSNKKKTNS